MEQRKQIISIFFFALLLFVIYQLLRVFSPFFRAFFWAAILTFAFYPFHQSVRKLLKNESLAAFVTTLGIVALVLPPSFLILTNLVTQTLELYQLAKVFVREGGLQSILQTVQVHSWFVSIQERVLSSDLLQQNVSNLILRTTQFLANFSTSYLAALTKNVFVVLLNTILVVIFLFFLVRDGEKIYRFIYELTPLEEKDRRAIFGKINDAFAGAIRGQLVTSLTQGFLAGVTFSALSLPAPLLFGFVTFVTSLIPITGASTVWLPFAIYLFLADQTAKAVILTLIGTFVISLSDNLLKPILIGERTKTPVFLLFLGIVGGVQAYGMTGIFLGPVFITLFFALIRIYQEQYPHPR